MSYVGPFPVPTMDSTQYMTNLHLSFRQYGILPIILEGWGKITEYIFYRAWEHGKELKNWKTILYQLTKIFGKYF